MSDFMEYADYYKKAWEKSLSERTTELQKEIETLRAENARYREALEFTADMLKACQPWVTSYGVRHDSEKAVEIAREALKGGE